MLIPDFAIAEVMNALYVQAGSLHLIEDGRPYLKRLFDIIDTDEIRVVACSEELTAAAYEIASRSGSAAYDCVFVALALASGLELVTRDRRQAEILRAEREGRRSSGERKGGR